MKAKLHRATATQADLDYEGSIAIDGDLLDAAGIVPHEQVGMLNITSGAAARRVQKNDRIIVVTYGQLRSEEARQWSPTAVLLDEGNVVKAAA